MNLAALPLCHARPAPASLAFNADWDHPDWVWAETIEVACFRPESSPHRPRTQVRVLYDAAGIHGIFRVEDRYVRCTRTRYGEEVWKDSCVEFFAQPRPDRGYFNFEFNCGGAFLCSYITDPERVHGGFKAFTRVPPELGQSIRTCASLPSVVEPERPEAITWTLRFFVPLSLLENYTGPLGELPGRAWRVNFFKCADESSQRHWASWAPVDALNFHRPACFGSLIFAA